MTWVQGCFTTVSPFKRYLFQLGLIERIFHIEVVSESSLGLKPCIYKKRPIRIIYVRENDTLVVLCIICLNEFILERAT